MSLMVRLAGTASPEELARIGGIVTTEGHTDVPIEFIQKVIAEADVFALVCELARPGLMLFCTRVEHTLFPPSDPALNAHFQLGFIDWKECSNLPFAIMIVPNSARAAVNNIAVACDLKIVDGGLMLLGGTPNEDVHFPISGHNVYRIESQPNSRVYMNSTNMIGGLQGYDNHIKKIREQEKDKTIKFLHEIGVETPNMS